MFTKEVDDILKKEGYDSPDEFLKASTFLLALVRRDQYQAECEFFANKYDMTVEEFEQSLHQKKGEEDFEKEKDLEDWLFAKAALRWWEEKMKEFGSAKITR